MFLNPVFSDGHYTVVFPALQCQLSRHPVGTLPVAAMDDDWTRLRLSRQELRDLKSITWVIRVSLPPIKIMVQRNQPGAWQVGPHLLDHLLGATPKSYLQGGINGPQDSGEALQTIMIILQDQDHGSRPRLLLDEPAGV